MSIEKQIDDANDKIDLLIEEQRAFWEALHDIVELAGDQFISSRQRFSETEKQEAERGGSLILSVVLIFGFSVFPAHTLIAGMISKGISKSKSIQKLLNKDVIRRLNKLSPDDLKKINSSNMVDFENQTINTLFNDPLGKSLQLYFTQKVKERISSNNINIKNSNQNEGIVNVKNGLYKWIAAHKRSDILDLYSYKRLIKKEQTNENDINNVLSNLDTLLKKSAISPTRNINEDDFQLLIEAAIWSATYDFFPGFRKKNRHELYRDPIKLPKNDIFWNHLISRFIKSGFMSRVFHSKLNRFLVANGHSNPARINKTVRETDLKKMRAKYQRSPQRNIGGAYNTPATRALFFDSKDEDKLLLTFYFDEISTKLNKMQGKIIKNLNSVN